MRKRYGEEEGRGACVLHIGVFVWTGCAGHVYSTCMCLGCLWGVTCMCVYICVSVYRGVCVGVDACVYMCVYMCIGVCV